MIQLLSQADRMLGKLNGLASIISDPDLFVYLYVRKEALLSSQIEGTQCSLEDVLAEGVNSPPREGNRDDIEEVSNYVRAMNAGLERLKDFPVSNRLLKEMHALLLQGVRGHAKTPGEFRNSQNWIGSPGSNLNNAQFVPPPPQELSTAMGDLETYIHSADPLPPLIRSALVHAQFETIHPFLDGNGRLGRLLITFLLCSWGVMDKPLLYLSYFFKANRTEYYARLMGIRAKGEWESWIKFFLRGIIETAQMASATAIEIHKLHQADLEKIRAGNASASAMKIFAAFSRFPLATVPDIAKLAGIKSQATVNRAIQFLLEKEIIQQADSNKRNRRFSYTHYLSLLTRDTIIPPN
jgi:Fic family protein